MCSIVSCPNYGTMVVTPSQQQQQQKRNPPFGWANLSLVWKIWPKDLSPPDCFLLCLCSPAITKLAWHASNWPEMIEHHHTSLMQINELQFKPWLDWSLLAEKPWFPPHCTIVVLCQFFTCRTHSRFNSPCGQVRERVIWPIIIIYFQAFLLPSNTLQ
jgi:hypothetical protein